jgi:hypothetical protein
MKFYEIISEASIFTRGKYTYGHKVRISSSKKGQVLLDLIQSKIPEFNANEDLEWVKSAPKRGTIVIQTGSGSDVGSFKRSDGSFINIVGTLKVIEKYLTHAPGQKGSTAENKGDLSEPLLSAAVVAKLIKRGANNIEDITTDDLKKVLMQALDDNGQTFTVNDKNSKVADIIKFTIALRGPALEYIKSAGFFDANADLLPSAVHYANSGQIDKYADYFYKNGKADSIVIKSDGQSDQKSRKTDIEAYVKDENGNVRSLKNLNISLKAGSPHIGQVGGGDARADPMAEKYVDPETGKIKGRTGLWTAANKLFSDFDVAITKPSGPVESITSFWVDAYKEAAAQLKSKLAGNFAKTEAGIIVKIADMVTKHGTSGDANVRLVSLVKGASTVHSFKGLVNKLTAQNINLDCEYRQGTSKEGEPRPEIRIFDRTSGRQLLFIRYSSTSSVPPKIWNTVEMKELLKDLTTLRYEKASQPTAPETNNSELDRIKQNAGIKPQPPGNNTTTLKGTAMVPDKDEKIQ